MSVKKRILKKLDTPRIRTRLALALDVTDQTIMRYLDSNSDNLTKAAALKVIREELNLSDTEILEELKSLRNANRRK